MAKKKENKEHNLSSTPDVVNTSKTREKKKYPWLFYITPFAAPVLFLLLLELILTLSNYGTFYIPFTRVLEKYDKHLFFNPQYPEKFFGVTSSTPGTTPDPFLEVKTENTYRVFLLGESSAAGWPFVPNASMSRQLKRLLEITYPNKNIEVINLGVTAINTYTIRDLIPSVIEQKPDLVIIYTGHNEFYGVYGVGSSQAIGPIRALTNLNIDLQKYRSYQFLTSLISSVVGFFGPDEGETSIGNSTLMEKMIGESTIPLNSGMYRAGISQFEGNMRDILDELKANNIPVMLSTLAANYRGLKPFVSTTENDNKDASALYKQANALLSSNPDEAKKLFLEAKEYDALRFRAPKAINTLIRKFGDEYSYPVVDLDSLLNSKSPYGITGNELMVDHLHPTKEGYQMMGEELYATLMRTPYAPRDGRTNKTYDEIYKEFTTLDPYTDLDSTLAHLRVIILTGSYPFVPKGSPNTFLENWTKRNIVDSLAEDVFRKNIPWEEGHFALFRRHFAEGNTEKGLRYINAVIADRPINRENFSSTATFLVANEQFDAAIPYLEGMYKLGPDAFCTKWLGQISLNKNNTAEALKYLEESVALSSNDAQVFYNLAGAYFLNKRYDEALETVKKSLRLDPNAVASQNFYIQLSRMLKKQ